MSTVSFPASASNPGKTRANDTESAQGVSKGNVDVQDRKLKRAAAEFESILISTFWKSMMETFSSDDDSNDPGHATFQDMGIQAMSQAMGKAGGLGLGSLMIKHLEPYLEGRKPQPVQGKH